MNTVIEVNHLVKDFKVLPETSTFKGKLLRSFTRKHEIKRAVDDISFEILQGEFIGYIGPNGAGKSTTIKILCGILHPTQGFATVMGRKPYENSRLNSKNIGVLFGQKTQLWWDLPIKETLRLHRELYSISKNDYQAQLKLLNEMLELEEFEDKPVRQLSLGQRMRGELAAAVLHKPSILILDEPTIGMDIIVKERIRKFLVDINKREGTTIILTTHDLGEIEKTCDRTIIINHGSKVFDGNLGNLKNSSNADSTVTIKIEDNLPEYLRNKIRNLRISTNDSSKISFSINRKYNENELLSEIFNNCTILDMTITEPSIDEIIRDLFEKGGQNEQLLVHN